MKKLLALTLLLCTLFTLSTSAQKRKRVPIKKNIFTCQLSVVASDTAASTVMHKLSNTSHLIPVRFKNGKYSYTFSTPNDWLNCKKGDIIRISHGKKDVYFVLDAPRVSVNLDDLTIKGGSANEKINTVMAQLRAASSKEENNKIALQAIEDNKDNAIAQIVLKCKLDDFNHQELQHLIDQGGNYLKSSICENIFSRVKRAPGQKYKDLEFSDTEGQKHKLSEYIKKGQYTLFDFWASWCRPCLMEMPYVVHCYKLYKDEGFNVVGISLDKDAEAWKKSIQQNKFDWIQLSDLKGWDTIASEAYGLSFIPANILCDGDGNIIATDLRDDELIKKLDELYGKAN